MQGLVKLLVNSLYGVQIRRDINESYYCKSGNWMKTEFYLLTENANRKCIRLLEIT